MSQLKGLHYQIWRHKKQILDLDATQKKKKGAAYFELPEDLDQEWIEEHQKALIEEQRTKIEKKFEKDNEKRKADKEKPLGNSELKERLKVLKEMETMYKKENKTNKVEAGPRDTVEGLHKKIEALEKRIENHKAQMEDREGNKEVALGTSKIVRLSTLSCLVHIHANKMTELHRPAPHGRVRQEIRCADREVLLENPTRQVPLGYQDRRGRGRLDFLSLSNKSFEPCLGGNT